MSLLAVEGLRIRLQTPTGLVTVVDGVDYDVEPGQVFGVAGESGSGKTMSMLALLGLLPEGARVEGEARWGGRNLLRLPRKRLREVSGRELAMVFQDPLTSLHPMLSVGESEYVQSARLLGAPARRALFRDVLPNVAGPVLVLATLDLAKAILLLSGLSFLGLGAQPPKAEWGAMVADGTQYFQWWWMGTFPGLAIFTVVLAFNFLGDSLRDLFDPQTSWRSEETEV